jgi:hypothetical protein
MHYRQVRAYFLGTDRGPHCRMMLTLEMRENFARDQFIGFFRRIELRPIMRQRQAGAKAAIRLLPQPLNLGAAHFGCADGAETAIVDEGNHLLCALARH